MDEQDKTVIRAFELPIHKIERVDGFDVDGWTLVRECWEHSTILANWCVQQLIKHDVIVLEGMEKLPKPTQINPKNIKKFGKWMNGLAR